MLFLSLLERFLPKIFPCHPSLHPSLPFLSPYLTISFGSFLRLDYGTGHEAAFALLLTSLALLRFIDPLDPVELKQIVLAVFLRYMQVCWRLQDVYKLEPAGSHGVWGLDDSSFLVYVFGSAQLRGNPHYYSRLVHY